MAGYEVGGHPTLTAGFSKLANLIFFYLMPSLKPLAKEHKNISHKIFGGITLLKIVKMVKPYFSENFQK